jgi:hypothetical protein
VAVTKAQLIALTRETMDAVASERWSDATITTVLSSVYGDEWSNILNAQPYYTFAKRTVTTDGDGMVSFSALSSGSGDSQQNFYRVLSVSDGNVLYTQTRFQDVPLATTTNYLPTYPRLFYTAGQALQILPVAASTTLYVYVNYKPTAFNQLATSSSVIDFPDGGELILANEAGAMLLNKGGAESGAARVLREEAKLQRAAMLDDLRRYTIQPTLMAYPDQKYEWGGA